MDLSKIDFSKCKLPLGYKIEHIPSGISIRSGRHCLAIRVNGEWSSWVGLSLDDIEEVQEITKMVDKFIAEESSKATQPVAFPQNYRVPPDDYIELELPRIDFYVPYSGPQYTVYYHRKSASELFTWWFVDGHGHVDYKCTSERAPSIGVHIFGVGRDFNAIKVKCADYDEILRSRAVHEAERKKAEAAKKAPRLPTVKPPQGCEWFWSDVVGHVFLRSRPGDGYLSQAIPYTLDSRDRLAALVAAYDELYGGTEKKAAERATPKPIELNGGRITSLFHDGRLATLGYGGTSKDSITIGVEFHRKDAAAIFRELDGMAVKSLVEMTIAKR